MKKIVCACLCVGYLMANDTLQKSSNLFKEGFDTLVNDMQQIKASTQDNQQQIQALNKKFDYIISKIQKDNVATSISTTEIKRLHQIIASLEKKINQLEQNKVVVQEKPMVVSKPVQKELKKNINKNLKEKATASNSTPLYNPAPKQVIVNDEVLNKIESAQLSNYSIQVGIFREKKSLNNAKNIFEKMIDTNSKSVVFEHCSSCKNKDLTKVLIAGFKDKNEAVEFVKSHKLKNSMIVDNRG